METLLQDLRYALRTLLRSPAFALVAVLTLALGIGANTAIFSVVDAVLLRPLPFREADRLMVGGTSLPDLRDLRERNRVFDRVAVWASNQYKITGGGEPEQVLGGIVSPEFFPLLGSAALGRTFRPEEDMQPLAVIGHSLWRRRFAGDPGVLGRPLQMSGKSYTIVGVMPRGFEFPDASFEVWVPMGQAMTTAPEQMENRQLRIFRMVAHLRPGVAPEQAQAELRRISGELEREHPDTNQGVQIEAQPLYRALVGEVRPALLVLLYAVGLVLLIACANVANLLLVRIAGRSREIAIRTALGADRWRVARQFVTESLVLALLGGAAGVALAAWILGLLPLVAAEVPRIGSVSLDLRVLLFSLAVSLGTGLLFGVVPALLAARSGSAEELRGGRGAVGPAGGRRVRGALVVGEVALTLVVLVGAGLLVQSLGRLLRQDPGFRTDHLLTTHLELFRYEDLDRRTAVLEQTLQRIAQLPGVQAVGGGTGQPPRTAQRATGFEVAGRTPDEAERAGAYFVAVTPGYFEALRTPVLRGRAFRDADSKEAAPVVIINRSLARRLFPGGDAVGRQIRLVNPDQEPVWRTVVGVVGDVRYQGLEDPGEAAIYTPFAQTPFMWSYLMVRTSTPAGSAVPALRAAVASVDPELVPARIEPADALVSESVAQQRFQTLLLGAFALLALLLAAVGIYGVVTYTAAQRTREIGVRVALGARPLDVVRMVVAQGMGLVAAGLAVGLVGAYFATRLLRSLVFGVSVTDPATFAGVAAALAAVALLASWLPARRATRVDPMVALRAE